MKLNEIVLLEARRADIRQSRALAVIDDNLKLTDKKGGPVRVVLGSSNLLSVVLEKGDKVHRIQANFTLGKQQGGDIWTMKFSSGLGRPKGAKSKITDEEMVVILKRIFVEAKKK
jgi:hypothetical protein